jgi:hypothetical protein
MEAIESSNDKNNAVPADAESSRKFRRFNVIILKIRKYDLKRKYQLAQ